MGTLGTGQSGLTRTLVSSIFIYFLTPASFAFVVFVVVCCLRSGLYWPWTHSPLTLRLPSGEITALSSWAWLQKFPFQTSLLRVNVHKNHLGCLKWRFWERRLKFGSQACSCQYCWFQGYSWAVRFRSWVFQTYLIIKSLLKRLCACRHQFIYKLCYVWSEFGKLWAMGHI